MGGEGTYGGEGTARCHLSCAAGRLSVPHVCRFYRCLLSSTTGHHGKERETEKEVTKKRETTRRRELSFNESLGICFLFPCEDESQTAEDGDYDQEAQPSNSSSAPAAVCQLDFCSNRVLSLGSLFSFFLEMKLAQTLWLIMLY